MKETEWCAGMKAGVKLRDKDDGRLAFSKKKKGLVMKARRQIVGQGLTTRENQDATGLV